jgi:TonB-linked SusC/RagA family outer membrane protein
MQMMKNIECKILMDRKSVRFENIKALLVAVFIFFAGFVSAQTNLTGIVTDAVTGNPISAARVVVVNKDKAATTDEKGLFKLSGVNSEDLLQIEAYDYNKSLVAIKGRDHLTIRLSSDLYSDYYKDLSGLTGKMPKAVRSTSAGGFNMDLKTQAITADEAIQNNLNGQLRSINRSGTAGMGASYFIRGVNSINLNAQPLFVVDGIVWNNFYDEVSINDGFFSNSLENIDINDIEDITVLKDGTSIYGSKASNGVVLINTKRGTTEVTKISLNISSGFTFKPKALPMMNSDEYRLYANDMFGSKGMPGEEVSKLGFLQDDINNPVYTTYHNNTDWNDEVYTAGRTNNYLINVNGGDEKALYYFSIGYTDNKGNIKGTDFSRFNTRFNSDLKLLNNLDMGLNIAFTRNERTMQDDGYDFYISPTWLAKIKSPFLSPYTFTSSGMITTDLDDSDEFGIGNPTAILANSLNGLKKYRFNIGVKPNYRINRNLTLSTQFDYNLHKAIERKFVPMTGTAVRMIEGWGESQNEISSQVMRNTSFFDETRLTYEKKLTSVDYLKAVLGLRYMYNYYESDYAEEHNTGSDNNTTITGAYKYLQVRGINNETKSLSKYLQAEYNRDNRYFLNAAVSFDASSKFGKKTESGLHLFGNSWGVFPSINAGWLVSSEEFMKNIDFINFMKLRGGYGVTGNDGIFDYDAMSYFKYVRFMDKANGIVLANPGNNKLQWETTSRGNIGIDLGLLNNTFTLSFDLFSGVTDHLLIMKDAPLISGLGKYWSNSGTMSNQGYEVSFDWKVLNLKNFKWEAGFNVGHYKNLIKSLPEGSFTTSVYDGEVIAKEGMPVGSFYGYRALGVFSSQQEAEEIYSTPTSSFRSPLYMIDENGVRRSFNAGDVHFDDLDKNGFIDENDKQVIGNPNPDIYGNIFSKMFAGRFSLSTVLTYSLGNDVYNFSRSQLEAGKDLSNQTRAVLGRWVADGQLTSQPRAVYGDPVGNARFSDRWIEDGSYLKMKTVTLSYDLPLKSNYIQGVDIWVSATNLFTLTRYLGQDPEFSAGNQVWMQGVDAGLIPSTKGFNIGFKFNL